MKNFPNLAKGIYSHEVQEAQRVPNKLDRRKHTPRHIIITLTMIKYKERIVKGKREKERVIYKGIPIRPADFSKNNNNKKLAGKKGLETSIPNHERHGPTSKITLSSKAII